MKELKYRIVILNILIILNVKAQQILPITPCPDLFRYEWDRNNSQLYGQLTLKIDNPNTPTVKLIVNLSTLDSASGDGALILLHSRQQTLNGIKQNKPIDYKIEFAPSQQIPRLITVNLNGLTLCNSEPENSLMAKSITLEHILQTEISNSTSLDNAEFLSVYPNQTIISPKNAMGFTPLQTDSVHESISQSIDIICGTSAIKKLDFDNAAKKVTPGSWPWLIAIFRNNGFEYKFKCAGTLVSSKIVLTAGHCLTLDSKVVSIEKILVVLGRHNINHWDERTTINNLVKDIAIHDEYRSGSGLFDADIAIVVLKDRVIFTAAIRPACLPTFGSYIDSYDKGLVIGWGFDETRKLAATPNKLPTKIVSNSDCLSSDAYFRRIISDRIFCAGFRNGTGACSGDSGNGLLIHYSNKWYLRGFVIGSVIGDVNARCDLTHFNIYTDVTKYLKWIYSYIDTYG